MPTQKFSNDFREYPYMKGKTWVSAYIYTAEPWEPILVYGVKLFTDLLFEKGLIERYFFIRYWERGPHLRLRILCKLENEGDVMARIDPFFANYFKSHPTQREDPVWLNELPVQERWHPNDSIQYVLYEPEVERYGGVECLNISEQFFQANSTVVLDILNPPSTWSYDRALGAAIQLHVGFVKMVGMDLAEASSFFKLIFNGWFSRAYNAHPNDTDEETIRKQKLVMEAFVQNYESQGESIKVFCEQLWNGLDDKEVEFEENWLNEWLQGSKESYEALLNEQKAGNLYCEKSFIENTDKAIPVKRRELWSVFSSYVHMCNNRLGIMNRDEGYLGFLLMKTMEHMNK